MAGSPPPMPNPPSTGSRSQAVARRQQSTIIRHLPLGTSTPCFDLSGRSFHPVDLFAIGRIKHGTAKKARRLPVVPSSARRSCVAPNDPIVETGQQHQRQQSGGDDPADHDGGERALHLGPGSGRDRHWNEDGARKQLVQFFEAWGPNDEATVDGRKRLSTILFS